MSVRGSAAALGLAIGLAALLLQFGLTLSARLASGDSAVGATVFFFSFFTILTNLMLVLIYLSEIAGWRWLGWWRTPVTRAMMAAAMALLMPYYHIFLAPTWSPTGWQLVADIALHYVTPSLYLLWWALLAPHRQVTLRDVPTMLLPPAIYVIYVMIRGAIVSEYPYPVLEANRLGYGQVLINIGVLLVVLAVLSLIAVGLDRILPGNGTRSDKGRDAMSAG